MILTNPFVDNPNPRFDVETLLRRHGTLRVLRELATVLLSRRTSPPAVDELPNHLRRDIGLETRHERPPTPGLVR